MNKQVSLSFFSDLKNNLKTELSDFDFFLKSYFKERRQEFSKEKKIQDLFSAVEYTLFEGGKRFRPLLVFCYSRVLGVPHKKSLPLALAIEMIHTASLIHDDLPCMDNDPVRRGKASHHKVFGEDVALLSGGILFVEPFYLLSKFNQDLELVQCLSKATSFSGMMGGQFLDLKSENLTLKDVEEIHYLKTGALMESCFYGVLTLAQNTSSKEQEILKKYSRTLSQLFQWADDLQDENREEAVSILKCLDKKEAFSFLQSRTQECLKFIEPLGKKSENLKQLALFNLNRVL